MTARRPDSFILEILVFILILVLPVTTFVSIASNPQARDISLSEAGNTSLKGRHSFSLQSRENLKFAGSASMLNGIREYYKAWPPAFPAMLYVFNKINSSPQLTNLMLYLFNMVWFYLYLKKCGLIPATRYLVLFSYAMGAFHYYNLAIQIVSEGLFIFTVQLIFTFTLYYIRENRLKTVFGLSLLTSVLILTKYMGLFWVLPIVAFSIIWFSGDTVTGLKNTAVYGLLSLLPTLPWFAWIYRTTGFMTGYDRSAERLISHLTDFKHNLFFSLKTYYVDFFSREWASHTVISRQYEVRVWDLTVFLLLSIAAITICRIIRGRMDKSTFLKLKEFRVRANNNALLFMLLLFSAANFAVILILWTIGNNDPVYTRFLYPSYPFLVLAAAKLYGVFMEQPRHMFHTVLFNTLFMAISGSQVYKTLILCGRYIQI